MADRTRITPGLLRAVGATAANAATYAPLLDAACLIPNDARASITSRNGVCMLVAQLAHESGGFAQVSENLNYSVNALLLNGRFTEPEARAFGRDDARRQKADQRQIANTMYGGRMGNAAGTDDGWTFRGGGPLQLTGRDNYRRWSLTIGKSPEEAAEFVRTPEGGVSAALWFWRTNNLLTPAWLGDVSTCTRIINGGLNGLADRIGRFNAAREATETVAA